MATAAIDHKYYGFYSVMNGYVQTLSQLAVYSLMTWKLPNQYFLIASYATIGLSALYAAYFGCAKGDTLTVAGRGYCTG